MFPGSGPGLGLALGLGVRTTYTRTALRGSAPTSRRAGRPRSRGARRAAPKKSDRASKKSRRAPASSARASRPLPNMPSRRAPFDEDVVENERGDRRVRRKKRERVVFGADDWLAGAVQRRVQERAPAGPVLVFDEDFAKCRRPFGRHGMKATRTVDVDDPGELGAGAVANAAQGRHERR